MADSSSAIRPSQDDKHRTDCHSEQSEESVYLFITTKMTIIWLLVGLGLIVLGADWLVEGASSIARRAEGSGSTAVRGA